MNFPFESICEFQQAERGNFTNRVTAYLKKTYDNAKTIPDDELSDGVAQMITKAESYGMGDEFDVANFVVTAWILGKEFDTEFPVAQQILSSLELAEAQKTERLRDWTKEILETLAQTKL